MLLTATPINNGLWDLYNLVMLFARHDRGLASAGIDSIGALFEAAGAGGREAEDLDPDALFPLADAVSVRRDRRFIEREYAGEQFPDGTPVRFPTPRLTTLRYDLDAAHPGLVDRLAAHIDALTMARYRPTAYELGSRESAAEAQLGGLLRSGILKRFESCWAACLQTARAMLQTHDAFLTAWQQGYFPRARPCAGPRPPDGAGPREEADEAGLASWLEQQLEGDEGTRAVADFDAEYADCVRADRDRLAALCEELEVPVSRRRSQARRAGGAARGLARREDRGLR